jgi:hypothetical protein
MVEFAIVIGVLFAGGGVGAVLTHLRGRALRNPAATYADAAALAESLKRAAADRQLTASELKDIAQKAEALANRLK